MLCLRRKTDESIIIDGHIEVKIIDIRGDYVRLGIEAHPDIPVWRKEIQDKIDAGQDARAA